MSNSSSSSTERSRPQIAERRAWVRYPSPQLQMFWHLFGVKPPERRPARIHDVSTQGIGLIVDRSLAQGSVLVLLFPGTTLESRSILVRVKYLKPMGNNEFLAGCTFVVPLTDTQLSEFVG
jgi:hypothetical protein